MRLPLNRSQLRVVLFLMGFLTLSVGMLITSGGQGKSVNQGKDSSTGLGMTGNLPSPTPKGYVNSLADGTIVYGLWNSSIGSQIRIVNTDGTNDFSIALLPAKIKDVHVLSNTVLLYINDTDGYDHGKSIDIYNTNNRSSKTIYTASPGWGIDDVIVSPDKSYIAWWEVKFADRSKILLGGKSRVYLKNINTDETSLVADEISSVDSPIHYPFFFDHKNRLFMDTFIPNQGRGYYLGVDYISPEKPTQIIPVPALAKGKFSSEIKLSPIANLIAYTSYDPQVIDKIVNPLPENPKRVELDNKNLLVVLDMNTFNPTIAGDSSDGKIYNGLTFSSDGKYLLYILDKIVRKSEGLKIEPTYQIGIYNLVDKTTRFITYQANTTAKLIDYINDKLVYSGGGSLSMGNLGDKYAIMTNSFSLKTENDGPVPTPIISQNNMQFITYQTRKAINGKLILLDNSIIPTPTQSVNSMNLTQLFIPNAPPINNRPAAQNNPLAQTNSTTNPDITPTPTTSPITPTTSPITPTPSGPPMDCSQLVAIACTGCEPRRYVDEGGQNQWDLNCSDSSLNQRCLDAIGQCYDSPLYLYPEQTTQVQIIPKVGKRISYSNPKLEDGKWDITAAPDGTKIEYNYLSKDVASPVAGLVSSRDNLQMNLSYYGSRLGLVGREMDDFVNFWNKHLTRYNTPYYFIGHYDTTTAAKIMSFEITPKVDTFIQVIMYFKPLAYPKSVPLLVFEPVPERHGFTAVDWSGKIDIE